MDDTSMVHFLATASAIRILAGICFFFPCLVSAASALQAHPSHLHQPAPPPALLTYHLGHTLSSLSSKPAFAQHAPAAPARWADTQLCTAGGASVGSGWWIFELPNRQRHPATDVSSLHLWMLVQASLILLMNFWRCQSATHGPLPRSICKLPRLATHRPCLLGRHQTILSLASHNHEEASSPRLSMPNYNRMQTFDPLPSSLICSSVSSAVSTPLSIYCLASSLSIGLAALPRVPPEPDTKPL